MDIDLQPQSIRVRHLTFFNVIIASRTWCHPWYWELHPWFPCLARKNRRIWRKLPHPHLLVAVRHIFPRCLLKATSSYPHLTLLKVGRRNLENNAHHCRRRTYNQCGGSKLIIFFIIMFWLIMILHYCTSLYLQVLIFNFYYTCSCGGHGLIVGTVFNNPCYKKIYSLIFFAYLMWMALSLKRYVELNTCSTPTN